MMILNTPQNPQPPEAQAHVSAAAHTLPPPKKITENLWIDIKMISTCKTTWYLKPTPTYLQYQIRTDSLWSAWKKSLEPEMVSKGVSSDHARCFIFASGPFPFLLFWKILLKKLQCFIFNFMAFKNHVIVYSLSTVWPDHVLSQALLHVKHKEATLKRASTEKKKATANLSGGSTGGTNCI